MKPGEVIMDNQNYDNFDTAIDPQAPLFIISVVSDMVHIPVWTLRKLDDLDIIKPKRIGQKTRCYSQNQIKVLNYVHYLMEEKGVNISGIKIILEIDKR
jgi:MerR family transcriptional regulator, heat shock protein HspR